MRQFCIALYIISILFGGYVSYQADSLERMATHLEKREKVKFPNSYDFLLFVKNEQHVHYGMAKKLMHIQSQLNSELTPQTKKIITDLLDQFELYYPPNQSAILLYAMLINHFELIIYKKHTQAPYFMINEHESPDSLSLHIIDDVKSYQHITFYEGHNEIPKSLLKNYSGRIENIAVEMINPITGENNTFKFFHEK